MKTVLLLALLSVAFVGCETSQSPAEHKGKSEQTSPVLLVAQATSRYQIKNGQLTFLEKVYSSNEKTIGGKPYACEIDIDYGTSFAVDVNERELILTNGETQHIFERTLSTRLEDDNYFIGQFWNEVEDTKTVLTFDENVIVIQQVCIFK